MVTCRYLIILQALDKKKPKNSEDWVAKAKEMGLNEEETLLFKKMMYTRFMVRLTNNFDDNV